MVVVVATVLEIFSKVKVPPNDPPMYPTILDPKQPVQDRTFAPLARTLLEDPASCVVSGGPVIQVPSETERIQFFSSCCWLLALGLTVGGNKTAYKCSVRP